MLDSQQETLSSVKSSTDLARLSVPPHRAELFLERLANLDAGDVPKTRTFAERFMDLLPKRAGKGLFASLDDFYKRFGVRSSFLWEQFQPRLRAIWREPAPLLKEGRLLVLAGTYMQEGSLPAREGDLSVQAVRSLEELYKEPDRFLMVLLYALKHVHLLRYCANPNCKEPYFVARRGSQVYCSSPCAEPAQREAKLKWWHEHGDVRRKKSRGKRGRDAKTKKA